MRPPAEIAFRPRQEVIDLYLPLTRPKPPTVESRTLARLPDPERVAARLRNTACAHDVLRTAPEITAHCFPFLGFVVEAGPEIVDYDVRFHFAGPDALTQTRNWRSTVFGEQPPGELLRIRRTTELPTTFAIGIDLSESPGELSAVQIRPDGSVFFGSRGLPAEGPPRENL